MVTVIDRFTGEHAFLSNFFESPLLIDGQVWRTAEHAYQAFKFKDPEIRETIRLLPTPGQAKRAGRKWPIRPQWDVMKYGVMKRVVMVKFLSDIKLAIKLLQTRNAVLIEGNNWGDKIWGQVDGVGENWLGKILMDTRTTLRSVYHYHE